MRIQTRLFLGTAALVLALMAVQWWLHLRQLGTIERGIGSVATAVGQRFLAEDFQVFVRQLDPIHAKKAPLWVDSDGGMAVGDAVDEDLQLVTMPDGSKHTLKRRITKVYPHQPPHEIDGGTPGEPAVAVGMAQLCEDEELTIDHVVAAPVPVVLLDGREVELKVIAADRTSERVLVVRLDDGEERRIPIPVAHTVERIHGAGQKGIVFSAGLLMVALVGSGVLASRLTRPLRRLADGAAELAQGKLGVQVPETATGEVGELQRAFNRMSQRLAELEAERDSWRRREHLVQLGDVSRGLAHTLRNPLNTLGLAVDELADGDGRRSHLATTARAQIRRIDRWLRSFLALGAGDALSAVHDDLCALAQGVVLEAIQEGAKIELVIEDEPLPVLVVPTAMRAAIGNLLENAIDAAPAGSPVRISVGRRESEAVIAVADRGPGLSREVRHRLYAPHVTTKVEGSGMGLFLARQLVVEMHNGGLELGDREGGGTVAELRLPLAEDKGDACSADEPQN
jgi:signal transduction histidine kinase